MLLFAQVKPRWLRGLAQGSRACGYHAWEPAYISARTIADERRQGI